MKQSERGTPETVNRRSFLKKGAMAAGAATAGAILLSQSLPAFGQDPGEDGHPLTEGDIAILRFVAAAELIESDLWIQYAELGGIGDNPPVEVDPNQSMNAYQAALSNL
ncbi:MAG: twin-arginine translocation signal domain-containing protein, partial [Candidatus Acidiferrales bacterium]